MFVFCGVLLSRAGEQEDHHGGRLHQGAHRGLAQEHQDSGEPICFGFVLLQIYFFFGFLISPQVLIKLIKPYTRIQIKFISGELNIESADVESLLVSCILDSSVNGRIDQVKETNPKKKTNPNEDFKQILMENLNNSAGVWCAGAGPV